MLGFYILFFLISIIFLRIYVIFLVIRKSCVKYGIIVNIAEAYHNFIFFLISVDVIDSSEHWTTDVVPISIDVTHRYEH